MSIKNKNIIISIDDISPHKYSGINAINTCLDIIKKYPNIKFVLFIPLAYHRIKETQWVIKDSTITKEPLYLNNFPEFCNILKNLPSKNFQLAYHGYYHCKKGNCWPKSNNDEFEELTYNETLEKIKLMEDLLEKCNLKNIFHKIFRPPGWKINIDSMKAFIDNGYKLALFQKNKYDIPNKYLNKISFINFTPPDIKLEKTDNDIHVVYHACEWLKNYITNEKIDNLIKFYSKYKINYYFLL